MAKDRPSRGSRYYRCLKFGNPQAFSLIATVHCPNARCLKSQCENYIPPLPRGRPAKEHTIEETETEVDARRAREAERLRDYRRGYAGETAEERKARIKREAKVDAVVPRSANRILEPGYVPSRRSKYHRCKLFRRQPFVCKSRPSDCRTCPHYDAPSRGRGRPKGSGMWDWDDLDDVREYRRTYMSEYREKGPQIIGPQKKE